MGQMRFNIRYEEHIHDIRSNNILDIQTILQNIGGRNQVTSNSRHSRLKELERQKEMLLACPTRSYTHNTSLGSRA
jgi:hypothetical protein